MRCSYGQMGHFQKDFPLARGNFGAAKSQENSSSLPSPPKGTTSGTGGGHYRLYALSNHYDAEVSQDVMTRTLQFFFHYMYVLLNIGSTLSYETPYVAISFDFEPKIIPVPFSIFTPI